MRIFHESLLRRALRGVALRTIAWAEETNNWDPRKNGELLLLRGAIRYCQKVYPRSAVTVIDAGANTGQYIDLVVAEADAIGVPVCIHAFEPQAQSCAQLLATHGRNEKVRLNQVALSGCDGEGTIFSDRKSSPLASMFERDLRAFGLELNQREKIKMIRLASYVQEVGVEHVNFLKLDVEGSEFAVLQGAGDLLRPDFIDFIQFEYGGTNLDARVPLKAFFSMLEAKGFRVAKVMQGGLRAKEYSAWMDNYLYANYVALSPEAFGQLDDRD